MNLQQFLSNGGFAKMTATIIQALFVVGAGILLFIEVYQNQAPNPYILGLLGVILGHQTTLLTGVQSSGDLMNALKQGLPATSVDANTDAMVAKTQATQQNTVATQENTAAMTSAPTQPKLQAIQGGSANG